MRKLTLSLVAVAGLFLTSCSREKLFDNLVSLVIKKSSSVEISIPPVPEVGKEVTLGQVVVSFNLDSMIRKQTNGKKNINTVDEVYITEMSLNLTGSGALGPDPDNNLANFSGGVFSFSSNTNGTPVEYAFSLPDQYSTEAEIPIVSSPNIRSYMTGNNFNCTLTGIARRPTSHALLSSVEIKFKIKE